MASTPTNSHDGHGRGERRCARREREDFQRWRHCRARTLVWTASSEGRKETMRQRRRSSERALMRSSPAPASSCDKARATAMSRRRRRAFLLFLCLEVVAISRITESGGGYRIVFVSIVMKNQITMSGGQRRMTD